MKSIKLVILFSLTLSMIYGQEKAITYLASEATLPNPGDLKRNGITRIEATDYFIGESRVMTIWTFNSEGFPLSIESIEYPDSISNFENFNYDQSGKVSSSSYIGWNENSTRFDTSTTSYLYFPNGMLKLRIWKFHEREILDSFYYVNERLSHMISARNYTYDNCTDSDTLYYNDKGKPIKLAGSDSPQSTMLYSYDEKDRLIRKVRVKTCVWLPRREEFSFKYDHKGRLALELVSHIRLEDNSITKSGYKYYYNRKGFLKRIDHLNGSDYMIHSTFKYLKK